MLIFSSYIIVDIYILVLTLVDNYPTYCRT